MIANCPGCVMAFLEGVASGASLLLRTLSIDAERLHLYMSEAEQKFSAQVRMLLQG